MFSILYAVYLFVFATALAFLEIQIEGHYGWAEKAPCWRPNPESLLARSFARVMGGKPLTGYHVAMFTLVLVILHFPFFTGVHWTLVKELETLAVYFLLAAFWDFLWFIWNPYYGIKKFKPEFIWWHKKWIGSMPTDYPSGLGVSLILIAVAVLFGGGMETVVGWGVTLGIFLGLTLISCLIVKFVRKGRA